MSSEIKAGRVRKPGAQSRKGAKRKAALKMMTVMQRQEPALPNEFLVTGRTGRRNAMPDILDPPHAGLTLAGLPERLQQLNTGDPNEAVAGSSASSDSVPKADRLPDDGSQQKNASS